MPHKYHLISVSFRISETFNYLVATGLLAGMILNFGERKVEIRRNVKDLN